VLSLIRSCSYLLLIAAICNSWAKAAVSLRAMPLQRGDILGYDFNRMVVEFTMLNQGKTVRCAIRT
jgi:hypothetical protein